MSALDVFVLVAVLAALVAAGAGIGIRNATASMLARIILVILFAALLVILFLPHLVSAWLQSQSKNELSTLMAHVPVSPIKAFVLGTAASAAFYMGVDMQLIDSASRPQLTNYLRQNFLAKILYFMFGGFVAAVVQLTSPEAFSPIQALVLGATWPAFIASQVRGADKAPPEAVTQKANQLTDAAPLPEKVTL